METKTTLTWLLRDQVSANAQKINGSLDKMGVKAKGASGLMGQLGNATGGLISPTTLGATAVLGLGSAALEAARSSIQAEGAYRKLGTALQANVPLWDGNTRAISDQLDKLEETSAFAKNDLRESFTTLVTATHSTDKAFTTLNAAMDLARLKGISLQEASTALVKVEGGHYRMLQSLGINLKSTADATEALAAVQQAAAGQMEDYANSHEGSLDKISNTWNDTIANLGGLVVEGGDQATKFFSNIDTGFRSLAAPIGNANDLLGQVGDNLKLFPPAAKSAGTSVAGLARDFDHDLTPALKDADKWMRTFASNTLSADDAMSVWLDSRNQLPGQGATVSHTYNTKHKHSAAYMKLHPGANPYGTVTYTNPKGTPRSKPGQGLASGGYAEEGSSYTVGESGRETLTMFAGGGGFVTPAAKGGDGFTIQGVSEAQIVAMVDRGLYFKLARASPSATRK